MAIAIPLMMFLKRLNYRYLQTPAVAFTAMGLVVVLLAAVWFADPRQHRWILLRPVRRFTAIGIRQARARSLSCLLYCAAVTCD